MERPALIIPWHVRRCRAAGVRVIGLRFCGALAGSPFPDGIARQYAAMGYSQADYDQRPADQTAMAQLAAVISHQAEIS